MKSTLEFKVKLSVPLHLCLHWTLDLQKHYHFLDNWSSNRATFQWEIYCNSDTTIISNHLVAVVIADVDVDVDVSNCPAFLTTGKLRLFYPILPPALRFEFFHNSRLIRRNQQK